MPAWCTGRAHAALSPWAGGVAGGAHLRAFTCAEPDGELRAGVAGASPSPLPQGLMAPSLADMAAALRSAAATLSISLSVLVTPAPAPPAAAGGSPCSAAAPLLSLERSLRGGDPRETPPCWARVPSSRRGVSVGRAAPLLLRRSPLPRLSVRPSALLSERPSEPLIERLCRVRLMGTWAPQMLCALNEDPETLVLIVQRLGMQQTRG